jgi:hypothetical protein
MIIATDAELKLANVIGYLHDQYDEATGLDADYHERCCSLLDAISLLTPIYLALPTR